MTAQLHKDDFFDLLEDENRTLIKSNVYNFMQLQLIKTTLQFLTEKTITRTFFCLAGRDKLTHRQKSRTFRARNYQRYIVLHSGTIEYQENSIWRRSRLDLQRSVFCTMTYTIRAPQIFYLMKRKEKKTCK